MAISKPYHRNCRPFIDGTYRNTYIRHPEYAKSPEQYIRAFFLLQKDLQELFDYIEPSDNNLKCYSFRIHELLIRSCIEVEANFKAILAENGYDKKDEDGQSLDLTMDDYKKLENTHKLSTYQVKLPYWFGEKSVRTPFLNWGNSHTHSLPWYTAYNKTKHNRHNEFEHANFKNLIDSVCGLLILISSQFHTEDFSPTEYLTLLAGPADGMQTAIGGYFRIKFPDNWQENERYGFDNCEWDEISRTDEPFQKIDYSQI